MEKTTVPKKGFAAFKAHFKSDFSAGFSVSLIALPLCLGIAIASGMPPLAGLITAIIGGMLASRISGTFVTISGPAAGLIVISLGAVESLGYTNALGAILVAGIFVALFGLLKVGKIGDFFPLSAVHGMLAAIGIIIIVKQIYPALGIANFKGSIFELAHKIPEKITKTNINALLIAIETLCILIIHPFVRLKLIKLIPAPLWVLIFSIPTALFIGTESLNMVDMPDDLFGDEGFTFPSFDKIVTGAFWISVIGFALVSSIESLLSAKAVDTLDPYKRKSNLDKDLLAMGLGSSIAASIGGLPMISEIVRSSANITYGAKTQWSNFFHGLFLLIFLFFGVVIIEMIPIAALAAMLVFTGFKLASPKEFKHMYRIGFAQLSVFVITLIAVLATDLIVGIAIGILIEYMLLFTKGVKVSELFKAKLTTHKNTINLQGSQTFSNYLSLKKSLDTALESNEKLNLDFTDVRFIDHTVLKHLTNYQLIAKQNKKDLIFKNLDILTPLSKHPLASRFNENT